MLSRLKAELGTTAAVSGLLLLGSSWLVEDRHVYSRGAWGNLRPAARRRSGTGARRACRAAPGPRSGQSGAARRLRPTTCPLRGPGGCGRRPRRGRRGRFRTAPGPAPMGGGRSQISLPSYLGPTASGAATQDSHESPPGEGIEVRRPPLVLQQTRPLRMQQASDRLRALRAVVSIGVCCLLMPRRLCPSGCSGAGRERRTRA